MYKYLYKAKEINIICVPCVLYLNDNESIATPSFNKHKAIHQFLSFNIFFSYNYFTLHTYASKFYYLRNCYGFSSIFYRFLAARTETRELPSNGLVHIYRPINRRTKSPVKFTRPVPPSCRRWAKRLDLVVLDWLATARDRSSKGASNDFSAGVCGLGGN